MNLFFDNCISIATARAVAMIAVSRGDSVVHLSQKFSPSTPDVSWISTLREEDEDWIIVSGDTRISRSPAERAAWHESGLTGFFLDAGWSNHQIWDQTAELMRWMPIILETPRNCSLGSGFKLPYKGKEAKLIYIPPTP